MTACRSEDIVDVCVLNRQLDRDRRAEEDGNFRRHTKQHQRHRADHHIETLVQRMAHQAVETVEPANAVVNRMEPPEQWHAVAEPMNEREGEIGKDDRNEELHQERPFCRPERTGRQQPNEERDERHAEDDVGFVDDGVQDVARSVALVFVPIVVFWCDAFAKERERDRRDQDGGNPKKRSAGTDDPKCETVQPE